MPAAAADDAADRYHTCAPLLRYGFMMRHTGMPPIYADDADDAGHSSHAFTFRATPLPLFRRKGLIDAADDSAIRFFRDTQHAADIDH